VVVLACYITGTAGVAAGEYGQDGRLGGHYQLRRYSCGAIVSVSTRGDVDGEDDSGRHGIVDVREQLEVRRLGEFVGFSPRLGSLGVDDFWRAMSGDELLWP
jgi:hypothetical protein